jgi:hypothetical protein
MPAIEIVPKSTASRRFLITNVDTQLLDEDDAPYCFRTDERFLCDRLDCEWRPLCCQLIAEWRR